MRFLPLAEPQMIVLFVLALLALTIWGAWRARKAAGSKRGRGRAVIAWVRRFLIGAALAVALAGPSVPAEEIELTSNIEIVFAVDRTGSMAAEDGPEGAPRLDAVRSDIVAILQATAGSRYSVLTWTLMRAWKAFHHRRVCGQELRRHVASGGHGVLGRIRGNQARRSIGGNAQ